MKKLIIATLIAAACCSAALAGQSLTTASNAVVQGFNPDGSLAQNIANSTIVDVNNSVAYGIYCPSDAKVRLLATNSKGSDLNTANKLRTVPGGSWYIRARHPGTPFVNVSTATTNTCEFDRN